MLRLALLCRRTGVNVRICAPGEMQRSRAGPGETRTDGIGETPLACPGPGETLRTRCTPDKTPRTGGGAAAAIGTRTEPWRSSWTRGGGCPAAAAEEVPTLTRSRTGVELPMPLFGVMSLFNFVWVSPAAHWYPVEVSTPDKFDIDEARGKLRLPGTGLAVISLTPALASLRLPGPGLRLSQTPALDNRRLPGPGL